MTLTTYPPLHHVILVTTYSTIFHNLPMDQVVLLTEDQDMCLVRNHADLRSAGRRNGVLARLSHTPTSTQVSPNGYHFRLITNPKY